MELAHGPEGWDGAGTSLVGQLHATHHEALGRKGHVITRGLRDGAGGEGGGGRWHRPGGFLSPHHADSPRCPFCVDTDQAQVLSSTAAERDVGFDQAGSPGDPLTWVMDQASGVPDPGKELVGPPWQDLRPLPCAQHFVPHQACGDFGIPGLVFNLLAIP